MLLKVIDILESTLDRLTRFTTNAGLILAGSGLLIVIVATTGAVVARDFFEQNWIWAFEGSGYALVFFAYFGAAYCFKVGGHISVTALHSRFPRRVKRIVDPLTTLLAMGVTGLMFKVSYVRFFNAWQTGLRSASPLEVPLWFPYSFIPIGLVLLFPELVAHFIRVVKTTTEITEERKEKTFTIA